MRFHLQGQAKGAEYPVNAGGLLKKGSGAFSMVNVTTSWNNVTTMEHKQ